MSQSPVQVSERCWRQISVSDGACLISPAELVAVEQYSGACEMDQGLDYQS